VIAPDSAKSVWPGVVVSQIKDKKRDYRRLWKSGPAFEWAKVPSVDFDENMDARRSGISSDATGCRESDERGMTCLAKLSTKPGAIWN